MENKISKIVVVDSNEGFSQSIKDYFLESKNDLRVVSCFNNIIDAIDYISDNEVDIVVADIMIPNADGYDLISEIKLLGLAKEPKIIIAFNKSYNSITIINILGKYFKIIYFFVSNIFTRFKISL